MIQHILAAIGILSLAEIVAFWITLADPYTHLLATAALALMMLIAYSIVAYINASQVCRLVFGVLLGVSIGLLNMLAMYYSTTVGDSWHMPTPASRSARFAGHASRDGSAFPLGTRKQALVEGDR